MKNTYKLFLFLSVFLLIGLVSANGIQITQGNQTLTNITINKTSGIDYSLQLNVSNQEAFDFYNLQFNQIISVTPFNLSSGETKVVTATINTNSDFNGDLTLIGYYTRNIGASNKTYQVNIDYNNGLDVCNLELIAGDSIQWINHVQDEVSLKNTDTGENIHTISQDQNYTRPFTSATEFNYQVTRLTLPFTQTCHINVQSTTGLVHSNDYDFSFKGNIKINYEPTNITTTFLTTNYTLNYNSNTQDIFQIKNNGTKVAKNIHLSGDWATFQTNNFDLNPGEQKNIGYTLQPQVFQTNDTNQTYIKQITMSGNFPTITQNISIFVPYAVISNQFNNGTFDPEFMKNLYNFYCSVKPEDPICASYYSNSSNQGTNVTYSADFIKALFEKYITLNDNFNSLSKNDLESKSNLTSIIENLTIRLENVSKQVEESNSKADTTSSVILFGLAIGGFIIFVIVLLLIWNKKHLGIKSKLGLQKGEEL